MNQPLKIHKSLLPKQCIYDDIEVDDDGFIHGYLIFLEKDYNAYFWSNEKVIFECSRPHIITMTQLLFRCLTHIYLGYDSKGNRKSKLVELTFVYN